MSGKLLPLVLIHGYPLDRSMWYGVIASLSSGLRTVAPDLRGFGKAGAPTGEPSLDLMAEDVIALLKRDGINKAAIAGMSMGGYVALAIAEKAPELVAGLALVDSQPYEDTEEARQGRRDMIKKIRSEGAHVAADAIIPKMFTNSNAANPDFQAFPLNGALAAGPEGLCWALEAMARRPDRSSQISEARWPVLILHGTDDKIVPLEKARQFAALNPKAFLVPIKKAGHGAVMEQPDEVATALRRFVEICTSEQEQPASATANNT